MKHNALYKWGWIVMMGILLAVPSRALAHGPATGGASEDVIAGLFKFTLLIAAAVFVLVEGLIVFSIVRYRRRSKDEMPEQVEGNSVLEASWTILAAVIIGVLFLLTLRALQTDYSVKADNGENNPDLTVRVTGYMFNWDYEYMNPDGTSTGVKTTKELTIPADRAVLLEITSSDVQHSFWVPELAGKVDAVPGRTNTMWLKVNKTGSYTGNCAEYCGLNHYNMLIEVDVLEPSSFDAWMADQEVEADQFKPMGTDMESTIPEGDAERGAQVFADLACSACHAPAQDQPTGPAVKRMMKEASEKDGYTPDEYLRESILMPCATLAEGYEQCIMPPNYGDRLDAQQLADLIEYLESY